LPASNLISNEVVFLMVDLKVFFGIATKSRKH
jgi:hypothetical protein